MKHPFKKSAFAGMMTLKQEHSSSRDGCGEVESIE